MRHLSGVDASFLHLETPEMPMHVGSLNIFDLPEGYTGDFYRTSKRISPAACTSPRCSSTSSRRSRSSCPTRSGSTTATSTSTITSAASCCRSPALSSSSSSWSDVCTRACSTAVGRCGSSTSSRACRGPAGDLCQGASCRRRRPGRRGAGQGYLRSHAGAAANQGAAPRNKGNRYQLGVAELATAAVQNTIQQYVKLFTTLPNALQAIASATMPAFAGGQFTQFGMPKNWQLGPKTPLNVSITNQRSFAARSVSLAEVKQIAKACGGTVNDIVRCKRECAAALSRRIQPAPKHVTQRRGAGKPARGREYGPEQPSSMMLVSLATDIADPLERLKTIIASSKAAKELSGSLKAAIPTDFPSFGAPWIMGGFALLFGRSRISDNLPPVANVAISNVPGRRCRCTWPVPGSPRTTRYPFRRTEWRSTSRCRATTDRWTTVSRPVAGRCRMSMT